MRKCQKNGRVEWEKRVTIKVNDYLTFISKKKMGTL